MEGTIEISDEFLAGTKWTQKREEPFANVSVFPKEDIGIQIAEDGRIWICINGVSFLRFKPTIKT